MSLKFFEFSQGCRASLLCFALWGKKRLSSYYPRFFIGGLLFLASCASPSLIKGVDFESEDFLDVLKAATRVDELFEKRTRCFFLDIKREGESKNIYNNNEYYQYEKILIRNEIYQASDKCANLSWKNIANFPVSWKDFSDSPDILLGVSVSSFIFSGKQMYSGAVSAKEFNEFIKKLEKHCAESNCSMSEKDEFKFVYIDFAVCDYPGYRLFFIQNKILDVKNHASYGCLK